MNGFFQSGRVVDCILMFMAAESMVLILVRRYAPSGLQPLQLLVNVGSGAALLLALRAALRGSEWQRIALWLLLALGCHVWDLTLRWSMRRTR